MQNVHGVYSSARERPDKEFAFSFLFGNFGLPQFFKSASKGRRVIRRREKYNFLNRSDDFELSRTIVLPKWVCPSWPLFSFGV